MRFVTLPFATAILLGCSEHGANKGVVERDSAGVHIVDLGAAPFDSTSLRWHIAGAPSVTIGNADGADEQMLSYATAKRMSDGRIIVKNSGTNQLRLFDGHGTFLRQFGGTGEGPGEFGYIGKLFLLPGDTLMLTDLTNRRVTMFDTLGHVARTFDAKLLGASPPSIVAMLKGTRAFVQKSVRARAARTTSQAVRDTMMFATFDMTTGATDTIGILPASESFLQITSGGVAQWNMPFGRDVYDAVAGDIAYIGVADRDQIMEYDVNTGKLRTILRRSDHTRDIRPAERSRFSDWYLTSADDAAQRARRASALPLFTYPPSAPAFADLRASTAGDLWVREYNMPWEDATQHWSVYDEHGRRIGRIDIPENLMIAEVGANDILVDRRDTDGIEHIESYRIIRSQSSNVAPGS